MEFVNAIFLGVVQGATEFLPISSSGHLIIVREILGEQVAHGLAFDAVLQLATTLAVLVYFFKDITGYIGTFFALIAGRVVATKEKVLLFAIILGTIPSLIIGLLFENAMETWFRNPLLVALMLCLGSIIMLFAEKLATQKKELTVRKGFWIGWYQALALVPGFSRSGMTISGGLILGLTRREAARFSFLLAFPVLFGAGLKKMLDLSTTGVLDVVAGPLIAGSIVSFIVGLLAIHFLLSYLQKYTLKGFVVYRLILALVVVVLFV